VPAHAITQEQRGALLRAIPVFAALPEAALTALALACSEERRAAGSVVICEGDAGDCLYVLADGRAEVTTQAKQGPIPLAALGPGEMFGELALLLPGGERQATVTTTTTTLLLRLAHLDFTAVLDQHPAIRAAFAAAAQLMLTAKFLKQTTPFVALDGAALRRLAGNLRHQTAGAGDLIIRKGEPGDSAYLVRSGSVQIVLDAAEGDAKGEERVLASLGPGALFGEAALLTEAPRNATVRVLENAEFLVLGRNDLLQAVAGSGALQAEVGWLLQSRDRPRRSAEVAAFHQETRDGTTITILKDASRHAYFRLSPHGWFIWQRLDGEHTLRRLVVEYLTEFKAFAPQVIAGVVAELAAAGFVATQTLRPDAAISLGPRLKVWQRMAVAARQALEARITFGGIDPWLDRLYRGGVHLLYTAGGQTALALLSAVGLVGFVATFGKAAAALHGPGGVRLLWLMIPAQLLNILVHEAGHGFTVKAFGREAPTAGIGWYWFGPIAFVDTTDMWLTARWPRIAVSLAGSYANLVTGGIAGMIAWLSTDPSVVAFCWEFALLSYIGVLINLNPLMEFDGYYVVADLLDRPNLRARALAWIGGAVRGPTPSRKDLREHRVELVFGTASMFYVLAIAALTIVFYRLVLQDWIGAILPDPYASALAWVAGLSVVLLAGFALAGEIFSAPGRNAA
jgi:CRP-like cAMP-binding protein